MNINTAKISIKKVLLLATFATLLCLILITFVNKWTPRPLPHISPVQEVIELALDTSNKVDDNEQIWVKVYESRVRRVRDVCERDRIVDKRRNWRIAANRRNGSYTNCKPGLCPIIVDEQKEVLFCFILKVASTSIKQYFLNISDITLTDNVKDDSTALHFFANDKLKRVSPMYYPSTTLKRFYKMIFVRHPFDRLVSAFRNKAEAPREEVKWFYDTYWDPIMKKLRSEDSPRDKITFSEFVWYLTHTLEQDLDDHWSPYWSRCDPCLIDYDFIGKIETAKHDFPYAFKKAGIEKNNDWWDSAEPTTVRLLSLSYFSTVSEEDIRKLYQIYKLDFDLFGYSVQDFVQMNKTRS